MKSQIINEIQKIRGETKPDVVSTGQSRYEVAVREEDAMATYLFSAPVRKERGGELVEKEGTTESFRAARRTRSFG